MKPAFMLLGAIILIVFFYIMYHEPSMMNISSMIDCGLDNSVCQDGQKELVNNLLLFGLVVIAGVIARREGWI